MNRHNDISVLSRCSLKGRYNYFLINSNESANVPTFLAVHLIKNLVTFLLKTF